MEGRSIDPPQMKPIGVLGASGGIGRRIVELLLARGTPVRAQTRDATRLAHLPSAAEIQAFEPVDGARMRSFVRGCEAIVHALGVDRLGPTDLFSRSSAVLIEAMRAECVERLVAITGVGAGETRGHGGFFYDRIVFALFTRHRYADKDAQEALIARSSLRWTIVRPAAFRERRFAMPLEIHTDVSASLALTGITRDEVARFVVDELDHARYVGQRPFIGHRR